MYLRIRIFIYSHIQVFMYSHIHMFVYYVCLTIYKYLNSYTLIQILIHKYKYISTKLHVHPWNTIEWINAVTTAGNLGLCRHRQ